MKKIVIDVDSVAEYMIMALLEEGFIVQATKTTQRDAPDTWVIVIDYGLLGIVQIDDYTFTPYLNTTHHINVSQLRTQKDSLGNWLEDKNFGLQFIIDHFVQEKNNRFSDGYDNDDTEMTYSQAKLDAFKNMVDNRQYWSYSPRYYYDEDLQVFEQQDIDELILLWEGM